MSDIILSRKADEHVPKNRWIASLSNGETIFEDNRKDVPPAWQRLGDYCRENELAITKLRVQLGPLEVEMPANARAYIQKKKMIATWAWSKKQWGVGHVDGEDALIHYIADDRSSVTKIEKDPGEPWTIYDYRPLAKKERE